MASAIEKVIEIAASNLFDNASVQTCLTAVTDLSNNIDTRVNTLVNNIIDGAPAHLDTIKELADALDNSGNLATNLIAKIDAIDEKASNSGGGGLDSRPQWELFATVSLNNVLSKYSNFSDDVGSGSSKINNFGEGAMAMNDRYFVTAKSHGGNDIWSFRKTDNGGQWQSWHRIPISGNKNVGHTKFGIEFFDTHKFYYGQPGYQDANNNYKGNVVLYNLGANPATLDNTLFPESDLSNNAGFGKGIAIDGNFLVVTADGNDTMGDGAGSIFIYKKDANGDFINHDTSYNIIHGDISSGPKLLGNEGQIAIKGDYFCTSGSRYDDPSQGIYGWKGAVIVYKKDVNDDWSQHSIIAPYYENNGSRSYAGTIDIRMTSDSIITILQSGRSLQIFNYDGTLKQHIETNDNTLIRNSIMFASDEYIITGEQTNSEYNPTLYKYSDPSWNTVSNVGDFLPIGNLEVYNDSRYGKFSAQYNNDLVFGQTHVDATGTGSEHGALYSLKLTTDTVSYINTKSLEGENILTKSIKFIGDEIPLQNQDGTKLSASKLIYIDDDISCNSITVNGGSTFIGDVSGNDASFNVVDIHTLNLTTSLTKSDVGLGNVDNTTDAGKPVSTAQQTALDLKANLAGPTFTGKVTMSDISANDGSFNVVDIAALKVNGVSITQNGSGGASLNVNSDISINAIDAQDASFNTLRTSGTMAMGGHIIPTANAQYDLGNAEYKIRHLFLSDNSLWIGDEHKIDVSGGKMRFKKRKTGSGFVPQEILDASGGSTADSHINGVIAAFGDVSTVDDIKLHHWEAWVADTAQSGVTGLLPHELFKKDVNFDTDRDLLDAVQLPTKSDAGAPATTPAAGTMVFNTNDNKLYIYNGSAWRSVDTAAV